MLPLYKLSLMNILEINIPKIYLTMLSTLRIPEKTKIPHGIHTGKKTVPLGWNIFNHWELSLKPEFSKLNSKIKQNKTKQSQAKQQQQQKPTSY